MGVAVGGIGSREGRGAGALRERSYVGRGLVKGERVLIGGEQLSAQLLGAAGVCLPEGRGQVSALEGFAVEVRIRI